MAALIYVMAGGLRVELEGAPARASIDEFNKILGIKLAQGFTGPLGATDIIIEKLEY